jgi:ABC-type glycerol-3-phosphate transport system substrate-binding protein
MTKLSILSAATLVLAAAAAPAAAGCVDVCVAYPYYGAYTTPASDAAPAASQLAGCPDPSVVYAYYGEATTATATATVSDYRAETPDELKRVLAGYGRDQYLGL